MVQGDQWRNNEKEFVRFDDSVAITVATQDNYFARSEVRMALAVLKLSLLHLSLFSVANILSSFGLINTVTCEHR